MSRVLIAACAALALSACATDSSLPPAPLDPCPTSAGGPVEPAPAGPTLTPAQQLAVDVGLIRALGPELGAAYVQWRDVDYPAWARRQAARVTGSVAWCASRSVTASR